MGRFHVTWDDGKSGVGSNYTVDKLALHEVRAGRHNASTVPRSLRVARSRCYTQEEGGAAEPENSDRENISGRDGDGDGGGVERGNDDVSGPDFAAAPGHRLRADQVAISQRYPIEGLSTDWTFDEYVAGVSIANADNIKSVSKHLNDTNYDFEFADLGDGNTGIVSLLHSVLIFCFANPDCGRRLVQRWILLFS